MELYEGDGKECLAPAQIEQQQILAERKAAQFSAAATAEEEPEEEIDPCTEMGENPCFGDQERNLKYCLIRQKLTALKCDFLSKIIWIFDQEILDKDRLLPNSRYLSKFSTRKSSFLSKNFLKNSNFRQKSKFSLKTNFWSIIQIFVKNQFL